MILSDHSPEHLRKKVNITTWGAPTDPQAYILEHYKVEKAYAYIDKLNKNNNTKFTLTHLFAKAIGYGLEANKKNGQYSNIGRIAWGNFKRAK